MLGLRCSLPDEDLAGLARFRLSVARHAGSEGLAVAVLAVGKGPVEGAHGGVTEDQQRRLEAACAAGIEPLVVLEDDEDPGVVVQVLPASYDAPAGPRLGNGPGGELGGQEDPAVLARSALEDLAQGDTARARRGLARCLELYPNHVAGLRALAGLEAGTPLELELLARARRLAPEDPEVEAACQDLAARRGDEVARRLRARTQQLDLAAPLRLQWEGYAVGDRPSACYDPLTPAGIYQTFLEAAFADGEVQREEEQLLLQVASCLQLDAETRRQAYLRAAATTGAARRPGVLDRDQVFRRLAARVLADSEVERDEVELLERVRNLLGIPASEALDHLVAAGDPGGGIWPLVEALLRDPGDTRQVARLRDALLIGSGTLRPGVSAVYAAALDAIRVQVPEALCLVLAPVAEAARYSQRLQRAVAEAAREAAEVGAAGRAAALALLRANPGDEVLAEAVLRGLEQALARGARAASVARSVRSLVALRPACARTEELRQRLCEAGGDEEAAPPAVAEGSPGGPSQAPTQDQAAQLARLFDALSRGAARGDKMAVLRALDALEEACDTDDPRDLLRVAQGRLEAGLAAAFHRWDDLLEFCVSGIEDSASGVHGPRLGWDLTVLKLAALEAMPPGPERAEAATRVAAGVEGLSLTDSQRAHCRRALQRLNDLRCDPAAAPATGPPPQEER